jgi:hypothetical protein
LVSFLLALVSAFTMLALSSISNSARFVAVTYAGLFFFTQALFGVVAGATGRTTFSWLSPSGSINQIGDVIFRLAPRYETPVLGSVAAVAALVGLSIFVLQRRVRAVEVVT